MANTAATSQPRPRSKLLKIIVIVILALIVIVGLAILIAWLIVRPKRLYYTIDDGSIHNFNINNNHLNSTYDLVISAHNPNHRVSVYYDSIEVSLAYNGQTLAFNTVEPFYQPRRNVTRFNAKLEARDVALSKSMARDMRLEKADGEVKLDIRIKATIRFKVGVFKFKHHSLRILCPSVIVHFSSSRNSFERAFCDLDY